MMNFIKNYLLLVLICLGFIVAIGSVVFVDASIENHQPVADTSSSMPTPEQQLIQGETREATPLGIEKMEGGRVDFMVELADSENEWQHGLMERAELPENHGMLFVFPDTQERSFWMKNVLIPLDVVFIDEEGIIHHIFPNSTPHDLTSIRSNGPVPYVLEIGGGVAEKLGIEVGDKVIHPQIHQ